MHPLLSQIVAAFLNLAANKWRGRANAQAAAVKSHVVFFDKA